jgi:hypothetical protein
MSTSGRVLAAALVILAATIVSGCGERSQVVVYKSGKYQGKPDARPWENEPGAAPYTTSKWTAGDKTSWETALRTRSQGQNEYSRTE